MLNRVAIGRKPGHVDAVLDFAPDAEGHSPETIEVTATRESVHVRFRLSTGDLEVLAVAFDNAVTGADGELYFKPKDGG